ncbi:MAG: hypothetical protein S4CHLAM20_14260 [Chlamydiia bacterium]|nr:hypothetical protein [Chlamydiia bacterium]
MKKYLFLFLSLPALVFSGLFYASGYEDGYLPKNIARPPPPFMWKARLKVDRAVILGYEHKVYEASYVTVYAGVSGGNLQTFRALQDSLWVGSLYLMARVYLLKKPSFQAFILYSPAGPSLLSKNTFATTGYTNRFVFQDQFGLGLSFSKNASIEFYIKQYHFSNGELFPVNGGIDIPVQLGFALKV